MATTHNTILEAEPDRCHNLGGLTKLVRAQAEEYLSKTPYKLAENTWLSNNLRRLVARSSTEGPRGKTLAAIFPDVMREDLLMNTSNYLLYSLGVIKHATSYKNLLWPQLPDCGDFDIGWFLDNGDYEAEQRQEGYLNRDDRYKRQLARQARLAAIERIQSIVEAAELFCTPPEKFKSFPERKGPAYIAIILWADKDSARPEDQIRKMKDGKQLSCKVYHVRRLTLSVSHNIRRANVHQPDYQIGYQGPAGHIPKLIKTEETDCDETPKARAPNAL